MYVSLEAREPFLDHEALLSRYFSPQLFDRPKQGFSAPIVRWLRGPLRQLFFDEPSPATAWILLQLQQWSGCWLNQQRRHTAARVATV